MAVIRDPAVCESCTQYTDPAKLITINTGDYHADIYFDRLEDMPDVYKRQPLHSSPKGTPEGRTPSPS